MLAFLIKYDKISVMETKTRVKNKRRIELLDEIRGIAVFCMVFYHAYYVMGDMFGMSGARRLYDFFMPAEPLFAALFIAVCGISCSLSENNLKRSVKILIAAAAFTFVTCFVMHRLGIYGAEVWFGILHFLGFSVLIYALGKKLFDRINPYFGLTGCAVLYPFFSGISKGALGYGEMLNITLPQALYRTDWLVPLGIYSETFSAADYFPLLPFIFIFFAGVFIGRIIMIKGFPEYSYRKRLPLFGAIGRHAFIIYVLHFPVIYGILYAAGMLAQMIKK